MHFFKLFTKNSFFTRKSKKYKIIAFIINLRFIENLAF